MMRVDGSASAGRDEIVLFPFDIYALPFRSRVQRRLVEATKHGHPVLEPGTPERPIARSSVTTGR
jgi:hypothetical protein